MTEYLTLDLLWRALSCTLNRQIGSWEDLWRLPRDLRAFCHRWILRDLYEWPARCVRFIEPRAGCIKMSTAFSGTGMAEHCAALLTKDLPHCLVTPLCWIEREKRAASLLSSTIPEALGIHDIVALLPPALGYLSEQALPTFDVLQKLIVADKPVLCLSSLGISDGMSPEGALGDLHVAGPPCTDFSLLGQQKKTGGVTMLAFLVWVRLVIVARPRIVVL